MIMRASVYVACAIVALAVLVPTGVSDAQTVDGSIAMVRKNFPTPGREDELQMRWLKLVEFLRKAEPNAVFQLHRTTKEPVVFLWYEVFESQAALDNHLKVVVPAFQKEFGPTPEGILMRPSEAETYRLISK
jgi:quinol monooxygenase YgiN